MKKIGVKPSVLLRSLWSRETFILVFIILICSVSIGFLSLLPSQAAPDEIATYQESASFTEIAENPVNAPYKLTMMVITELFPTVRFARAVSFVFYLGACVALFYAVRHWHSMQASVLTTLAFASNAIMLSTGRLATPLITLVSFFIFGSLLLWQIHSRSNKTVPILVLISTAALLYVPGALWFLGIIAIVYINRFKALFKNVNRQAILVGAFMSLLVMSPLIASFVANPAVFREWLLLPQQLDWSSVIRSILRVPSAFIYRMPVEPLINIGRLPVFDLSSGILFLIGLYAYLRKLTLDRTRIMIGSALVSIVIGALGETTYAVIILLPFAYSVVAAGIEYLLDEWYAVFPRNPIARSFGMILLTTAVLFSMYYQLTRFFVVWPQTPQTRETYTESRILNSIE